MDSHVLRRTGSELASQLIGARIETVYRPSSSVFVFKISRPAHFPYLILQSGKENACLLPNLKKMENPASPDAPTMRLRKYLCGRRISGIWLDWAGNSLILGVAPRRPRSSENVSANSPLMEEGCLFVRLCLKSGPRLCGTLPASAENLSAGPKPHWEIKKALSSLSWQLDDLAKPWEDFPYLTPLLRKTLILHEDEGERLALLADLEGGEGDIFVYSGGKSNLLPVFSAWPLPDGLRPRSSFERIFTSALEALEECAGDAVFAQTAASANKQFDLELERKKKRIQRAFAKLEQEGHRLNELGALKEKALFIQARLYSLDKSARLEKIELPNNCGEIESILLDKHKSLFENMELMFKKAAKAARGLPHLERRKKELEKELEDLEKNIPPINRPGTRPDPGHAKQRQALSDPAALNQITLHTSPSGLRLLRGKNAKGNRDVLKMAAPHDLWLHAEGGPGAHVIIKLPHAAYIPQEDDLEMAARLAAEKSWQRDDSRAKVICAMARDVHPIKGAPHGAVRVDRLLRTISVRLKDN